MDLGKNIKWARKRAGITQAALVEELGVGQVAISRWADNSRTPSAAAFGEICRATGASAGEILGLGGR